MDRLYWNTPSSEQGGIVVRSRPQLAGAAEGVEGRASRLRLSVDRSNRSWTVSIRDRVIGSGVGDAPTVEEALAMLGASVGSRRGTQPRGSRHGRREVSR